MGGFRTVPHFRRLAIERAVGKAPAGSPTDYGRVTSLGLDVSLRLVRRRPPAWRESALSAVSRFRRTRQHPQAASPAFFTEVRDSSIASALCQLHPRELFRAAVMASEARQWVRDLVAYSEKYDFVKHAVMVISSGPPHDAHVAAAVIATRRGVPQVVDLRDPWTGNTGEVDLAKFFASKSHRVARRAQSSRECRCDHREYTIGCCYPPRSPLGDRRTRSRRSETGAIASQSRHASLRTTKTTLWCIPERSIWTAILGHSFARWLPSENAMVRLRSVCASSSWVIPHTSPDAVCLNGLPISASPAASRNDRWYEAGGRSADE